MDAMQKTCICQNQNPHLLIKVIMNIKKSTLSRLPAGTICSGALLLTASTAMAQNLFVAENISSGVIYEYSPAGVRSTFASTGLNYPYGLAFNSSGNLFVANNINDAGVGGYVTEIAPGGAQTTIPSGPDPKGLAFDSSGNLFE